ncbi:phosphoserine phosphatase SerB [Pleionea litopenaei]|uniref:Phosphoserine phosphatase n=1 Tax=Pleionea litopenaei TaxID=3070815 RepID=A0AA51RX01_9GAMM|nr:phosphoserine phosphatase SerB [Pleionea sp. HL-JVS1]WMS89009.1 phosphoserine phosphatase SerB [Pleionea sp. HL-JVS1]
MSQFQEYLYQPGSEQGWQTSTLLDSRLASVEGASLRVWPLRQEHLVQIQKALQTLGIERFVLCTDSVSEISELIIECSVDERQQGLSKIREMIVSELSKMDVNFALMDNAYRAIKPRLMVFDMDSTLIQMECIDEIARRCGCFEQVAEITERAMQGELDFAQSLRARVALLNGLPESEFLALTHSLPVTKGVTEMVAWAKAHQCQVAVVSGGFIPFVEALKNKLGLDYAFANELAVEQEKLTGEVVGEIVDGGRKRQILMALREELGLTEHEVWAVGDGANDLPMLAEAGLGVAFDAKPKVRAAAYAGIHKADMSELVKLLVG